MIACNFLDAATFARAEERRMALAKARGADPQWLEANKASYGYARISDVLPPGSMWLTPWYFDPKDLEQAPQRAAALKAIAAGTYNPKSYLSKFYWQTWSHVRAPISVLCPNGVEWCVDARSSNGDGWTVEGEPPALYVRPSIQVPGYHGWLGIDEAPRPGAPAVRRPGIFSGDIDAASRRA